MDNAILPAMTYGAETWSATKNDDHRLSVAQRSMERSILNISRLDKLRNEKVRERTGTRDIIHEGSVGRSG